MAEETANRSIRAPVSVWATVKAEAAARGMNVNSWVCMVMTEALGSKDAGARFQLGQPAAAPRQDVAKVADAVRSAEVASAAAEAGPRFGYVRPEPGARLKGANRQPRR